MDFQWGVLSRLRYHSIDWEIFVTDDSYSDDWELLTKVLPVGHSIGWEIFVTETPSQKTGCSFLWSSSEGVFSL